MFGNPKNTRKRLNLKEQLELIEDSLMSGFKQSKAALKSRLCSWNFKKEK